MQSVKIYPAELGVSGWLETSTYKNHQFNHEDEILDEYDYVVVGAGYGGLGAATRLKELYPNAKIAVFEALRIGSNDSGKNAGFLIDVLISSVMTSLRPRTRNGRYALMSSRSTRCVRQ